MRLGGPQILLARHGGMAPPTRRRARSTLTLAEREDISRGIAGGASLRRSYGRVDGEPPWRRPEYRANDADQQAWESALRPKTCLLAIHEQLRTIVAGKLLLDWSPEQISGWLKQQYPNDEDLSHETIYRSLFIQARGALKAELVRHLRSQRRIRRSRHASIPRPKGGSSTLPGASVEDRAVPGALGRRSVARGGQQPCGYPGGTSFALLHAGQGARQRHRYGGDRPEPARAPTPANVRRWLTWDRGLEMAQHRASRWLRMYRFTSAIRRAPGRRGSNETPMAYYDNTCRKKAV